MLSDCARHEIKTVSLRLTLWTRTQVPEPIRGDEKDVTDQQFSVRRPSRHEPSIPEDNNERGDKKNWPHESDVINSFIKAFDLVLRGSFLRAQNGIIILSLTPIAHC